MSRDSDAEFETPYPPSGGPAQQISRREAIAKVGATVGGVALATSPASIVGGSNLVVRAGKTQTLTVALSSEPPSLFQNLEDEPQAYSVYDAIFEYLVKPDARRPNAGPQPQLAVSWRPIGTAAWEFKLRQGVKFHNGEVWDAEAAKINFDVLFTIKPPSPFVSRIAQFDHAEVKDKYTLIIHTKGRWATAPIGLSEIQMAAPAYLKRVGAQAFAQHPIGTGPFKFANWAKGQAITLDRNPTYWGGRPNLDQLVFRGIPDPETRFAALQSGEIQMLTDLNVNDVPAAIRKGFRVAHTRVAQSILISPYIVDARKAHHPIGDPRVRLAMNLAINRPLIIKAILNGFAFSLGGQVTGPDAFGWNPYIKEYPYNPNRAKALLAEAGHKNGVDLGTFWIGVPGQFLKQREFAQVLVQQFAASGMRVHLRFVEYATFLKMALQQHNLDYMHQSGWQYYPAMDASFALQWYATPNFPIIHTGLGDPHYDKVFAASQQTFDQHRRLSLLRQCQRIIHDKPGPITLWQHVQIFGVSKTVTGFTPTPDERIHFLNVGLK
jgi:peptide/nickel transport system substrate-binding protein